MTTPTAAWQQSLVAEQQGVFGYAQLGPHLESATEIALAHSCQGQHMQLRDQTAARLAAAGLVPASAAFEDARPPVRTVSDARRLAVDLEQAAAHAWRFTYSCAAQTGGGFALMIRGWAQDALIASAIRGTQWRRISDSPAATVAFPGL